MIKTSKIIATRHTELIINRLSANLRKKHKEHQTPESTTCHSDHFHKPV